ncbi:MAG: 50S ribosomal protein L29 [Candidatus Omnitrophica bacterium]|nr:50S ribosomal protein L29 [Candidatus Omnitrophota bacterium]
MAEKPPRAKDLRALSEADLKEQLAKLRRELWHHRVKAKEGSMQQTHLLPAVRRQIARCETVMRER